MKLLGAVFSIAWAASERAESVHVCFRKTIKCATHDKACCEIIAKKPTNLIEYSFHAEHGCIYPVNCKDGQNGLDKKRKQDYGVDENIPFEDLSGDEFEPPEKNIKMTKGLMSWIRRKFGSKTNPVNGISNGIQEIEKMTIKQIKQIDMSRHHSELELRVLLEHTIENYCPDVARLHRIGHSAGGKPILALVFSKGVKQENDKFDLVHHLTYPRHFKNRPDVKFVSNIHGNEMIGRESTLIYAMNLCKEYNWDSGSPGARKLKKNRPAAYKKKLERHAKAMFMIEQTSIHFVFDMNPDGHKKAYGEYLKRGGQPPKDDLFGRYNAAGVDLNRKFPRLNLKAYAGYNVDNMVHHLVDRSTELDDSECTQCYSQDNILEYMLDAANCQREIDAGHGTTCSDTKMARCWSDFHLKKCFPNVPPEVATIMRWSRMIPFTLGAGFHGGELLVNYAFDVSNHIHSGVEGFGYFDTLPSITPNFDHMIHYGMAENYVANHAGTSDEKMSNHRTCNIYRPTPRSHRDIVVQPKSPAPITNGATWYSVQGSMQDWSYLATNAYEITVEMGCKKWIEDKHVRREYYKNRASFDGLIERAHMGVRGKVNTKDCTHCRDRGHAVYIETEAIPHDIDFSKCKAHKLKNSASIQTYGLCPFVGRGPQTRFDSSAHGSRKIKTSSTEEYKVTRGVAPTQEPNPRRIRANVYSKPVWDFTVLLPLESYELYRMRAVVVPDNDHNLVVESTPWAMFERKLGSTMQENYKAGILDVNSLGQEWF